jgi:aminoglycoside 2'-N-acetyltransferase I
MYGSRRRTVGRKSSRDSLPSSYPARGWFASRPQDRAKLPASLVECSRSAYRHLLRHQYDRAVRIVSRPEADVPRDLRVQVLALQDQAWPSDQQSEPGPIHDPALRPQSMLLVEDSRVLAALDILSKDIVHCGQRYAASGLSTVVTDRSRRGLGYGQLLVEAAGREMATSGADLGIFTCDRPLQAFYERAGWRVLPHTVLVGGTPAAPFPSDQFEKVTMGSFFSVRARASAELFIGCRIELYPGAIDRLW